MNGWMESKESLLKQLNTDASCGLSSVQVEANRQRYGANELMRNKPESLFRRIWEAATEPMIVMLIIAWLIALALNLFRHTNDGQMDLAECTGILIAILLSIAISVIMEGKSAKAFEALSKISDNTIVRAIRNGSTVMLAREDIVTGDILLLSTGDKIPADGRLLESAALTVDESALTGESMPAEKNAGHTLTDTETPLAERSNMLHSGTWITGGHGKIIVTATGNATEFGQIARELGMAHKITTPLQEKLTRLGKTITFFGVIVAIAVFAIQIISLAWQHSLTLNILIEAFITSIALIVAIVPEGLPTIVAITLSINIVRLARQNALVKKLVASETIGCINIICSDKTGTLTENRMRVASYYDTEWHTDTSGLIPEWLIYNICLNTTADIGKNGEFLGNPTECAILELYEKSEKRARSGLSYRDQRQRHTTLATFPFSSKLQHMTTVSDIDGKTVALVKGSPERILAMSCLSEEQKEKIGHYICHVQEKAMRVIAFAHKILPAHGDYNDEKYHHEMESDMHFDGFVAITDPLRNDVSNAVRSCHSAGIGLKILTGDNIVTASAIARELGLLKNGGTAIEAKDIADMSDIELLARLPSIAVIARSTPATKMRIVKLLKEAGNVVAVTGDGINDAPSLKYADVGIAMGIARTKISREASDIVLLDDSFATIVKAIEWGRNIFENFKRFITFQLTVNLASVITVMASVLMGLKAPFTALELLWINIIMDGPPALTLGLEPGHSDIMQRQPVGRNESIISRPMLQRIAITAIYMAIVFLAQYRFNFLNASEAETGTVLFTLFIFFQLFNAFNCRELRQASFTGNFFKNRLMLAVTGGTFLMQILIIQYGSSLFGTVPLEMSMWFKLTAVAATILLFAELLKLGLRLSDRQPRAKQNRILRPGRTKHGSHF